MCRLHSWGWQKLCSRVRFPGLLCCVLALGGCVGQVAKTPPPAGQSSVAFGHVFIVVEENHNYSDVVASPAMPYLNNLANQYGLATNYFANAHPSIPNYFMLTAGRFESLNNAFSGTVSDDNVVRELVKAGKTWRSYAESLPKTGYTGGDAYPYFKHHDPFVYLSDVVGTPQANNVVPFSQFSSDLASNTLPDFSFIVPNVLNDAHDGSLSAADQWLSTNIDPLIKSSAFQSGGVLIIVFDEGDISDLSHGGGHVPFVIVGPHVKSAFRSSTFYQHQSTLRLVLSTLGINSFPGAAASAPDMSEFFK